MGLAPCLWTPVQRHCRSCIEGPYSAHNTIAAVARRKNIALCIAATCCSGRIAPTCLRQLWPLVRRFLQSSLVETARQSSQQLMRTWPRLGWIIMMDVRVTGRPPAAASSSNRPTFSKSSSSAGHPSISRSTSSSAVLGVSGTRDMMRPESNYGMLWWPKEVPVASTGWLHCPAPVIVSALASQADCCGDPPVCCLQTIQHQPVYVYMD